MIEQSVVEVSLPLPEWPVWVDLMSIAPSELSEKEEGVISTNWRGWWRKIGRGGSERSTADIRIGSLGRSEHMNCVLSELDHWSVQNTWGLYYQKWITQLSKFQTYEWFTSRVGSSYISSERANLLLGMTWHDTRLSLHHPYGTSGDWIKTMILFDTLLGPLWWM